MSPAFYMHTIVFYFVTIAAVIFIIQKILFWLSILQKNDFEIKKTFLYFSSRKELSHIFISIENISHILLIFLYFITIVEIRSVPYYTAAVSLFFLIYLIFLIRDLLRKRILVPRFDFQVLTSFLIVFFISIMLMVFPLLDDFFWYLLISKMIVLMIFGITIFFQLPKGFYQDFLMLKSSKKISQLDHLNVLVIFGEEEGLELQTIISQLLSQRYSVQNVLNTGTIHDISKAITKQVTSETDYLIVPITTQEKEEIAEIVHVLHPSFCIINQKSVLPFNQSKKDFEEFISLFDKKTNILSIGYTEESDCLRNRKFSNFLTKIAPKKKIKNLYMTKSRVIHRSFSSFVIDTPQRQKIRIKTSIINPAILSSVFVATVVARELKFTNTQTIKAIENILPIDGLLSFKKITNGAILVNASLDKMATDSCKFLEMVRGVIGRKIVVCSFTEDFGRATKEKYQKLGETLSKSADILYFVSSQQSKFASSSVSFRNKKSRFLISTAADIEDSLRKKLHKNDVCLFVGEHADQLFDKFT